MLQSLPFQKVVHKFTPPDVQPTAVGGALISVLGQLVVGTPVWLTCEIGLLMRLVLQVDDSDAPLSYAQTFLLAKDAGGNWYVQNDIFKLVVF